MTKEGNDERENRQIKDRMKDEGKLKSRRRKKEKEEFIK